MTRSLPFYSRRPPRMRRLGPEASLQMAVCEHLRLRGAPGLLYFHPCNEGKRSEAAGLMLKRMGMLPGVADLVILLPGKPVLFLELKARGEKQSPEQIAFEIACGHVGAEYAIGDNIDAILNYLTNYGALTRRGQRAA